MEGVTQTLPLVEGEGHTGVLISVCEKFAFLPLKIKITKKTKNYATVPYHLNQLSKPIFTYLHSLFVGGQKWPSIKEEIILYTFSFDYEYHLRRIS